MTTPITLRFLPPDENVPADLPAGSSPGWYPDAVLLNSYAAERFDGASFFVAFGIGKVSNGELQGTPSAQAAFNRANAAARERWGKVAKAVIVERASSPNRPER
jgi:hypothetical protein